ncbi:hypothetical protein CYMTET_24094 [Cymbomonas tetramitiformis]|uniref:Secreted protein n=1 Tax=Cymbomonas tetramitiformis TaxID=36881 RepID=A0AAE0L0A5_9CHLO|nr:hypothetical protein CYMTET_24094 [Cymbomonas tetramitiformis]
MKFTIFVMVMHTAMVLIIKTCHGPAMVSIAETCYVSVIGGIVREVFGHVGPLDVSACCTPLVHNLLVGWWATMSSDELNDSRVKTGTDKGNSRANKIMP